MKVWMTVLGCGLAMAGCDGGDGDESGSATDGETTSTTDDVATTIPVTSVSETTTPDPTTGTSGTSSGDTSTAGDTGDTETDTESSGDTGTDTGSTTDGDTSSSDETTSGPTAWDVDWCNLQFPETIVGSTKTVTTAYSRVYVEGLTDLTPLNNVDPLLVVEFGYGDDGSDPGEAWTWVTATPNLGWNGNDVGAPNNDEYQGDLQFAAPGTYDYAARVSGDEGVTWVYCDLDGWVEGGYTPDQAGDATIE